MYLHVLQSVCYEQVNGDGSAWFAASSGDEARLREFERGQAAQIALCVCERSGEPVNALSYHLPDGMPPLFAPFPVRGITVMPDDKVTLQPKHNGKAIR